MNESEHNIGIIGCGEFAKFTAEAFGQIPGVRIAAAADVIQSAAQELAGFVARKKDVRK